MTKCYFFIHGALHGSWCWDRVVKLLKLQDPDCIIQAITLKGLSDRQEEMTPNLSVNDLVCDLEKQLEPLLIHDVVLIAHSYGAVIANCLNEKYGQSIRHLILFDGLVCDIDKKPIDIWSLEQQTQRLSHQVKINNIPCFDVAPAEVFGINELEDIVYVNNLQTPQPISTYTTKTALKRSLKNQNNVVYFELTTPKTATATTSVDYIQSYLNWNIESIDSGHDVMITDPKLVIELIAKVIEENNCV
ncbi:alpha/beta hydrolase [Vibrio sp. SS-MA-C1-2]|uniref:alpha/beta fold hydrolase n=1 Tax=Vibrio sp. SS-MA-C1-2 TaxID=2908646 RepID=UPI001F327F4C|nr:alpha/beta fold hydrolase [Vibrio sp. SS-MA-C1-2]UJF18870.1 alpha/beta hydrolase [Vibrio sp. SS-MA-C1-2]